MGLGELRPRGIAGFVEQSTFHPEVVVGGHRRLGLEDSAVQEDSSTPEVEVDRTCVYGSECGGIVSCPGCAISLV